MFPKVSYMLHPVIKNVTSPLKKRTFNISSHIKSLFRAPTVLLINLLSNQDFPIP